MLSMLDDYDESTNLRPQELAMLHVGFRIKSDGVEHLRRHDGGGAAQRDCLSTYNECLGIFSTVSTNV